MKALVNKMAAVPNSDKILHWFRLISITGGAQLIVQVLGLITGFLIIRLLPTKEYGLYTLANTMLGTMTILADGGISTGVMAQGGKVWQDKVKLGKVLATGMDLRKKFAFVSLIISSPILIYLLIRNDASWVSALLIVASLIPAFYAALSDSLLEIVPKLHQSILPLQKNQVVVTALRLFLSAITLFAFPWTFVAVLASSIPRIYGNIKLKAIASIHIEQHQQPDPQVRAEILKGVKRLLPLSIYFTVSGQITIWLLSVFGNSTTIGQIGALSRFSMLLALFTSLFSALLIPRFARLKFEKQNILAKYFQINLLLVLVFVAVVVVVWAFQNQLLWVLGSQYAELNSELVLVMISGCLGTLVGLNFSLLTSRGWIMHPALGISLGLLTLIIGATLINLSTLRGAIYYNLFLEVCSIINVYLFFMYNLLNKKNQEIKS